MEDLPPIAREAIYLRGLFVYRHAGIEYAISELLVRARLLAEYATVGDLPFKFESRLRLVERVMEMPGRLHRFRDLFGDALASYREYTPHRRLMVHGLMTFPQPDEQDQIIKLRAYSREGRLHMTELNLTLPQMGELVDALFSISGVIPGLVGSIIDDVPLPQVARDEEETDLWGQPQGSPPRL